MGHVLELNPPDNQRVFIVSDLHGMKSLYDKGCKELGITKDDMVVFCGDYIDRGPNNFACVVEAVKGNNRYGVIGNHEDMLIKGILKGEREWAECWLSNGGIETLKEVGEQGLVLLAELCEQLPTVIEINHRGRKIGVVHAGIPLRDGGREFTWGEVCGLAETSEKYRHELVWDRNALATCQYEAANTKNPNMPESILGVDYLFHGHSYVKKPEVYGNRIYIDTGSVFNGKVCFAWIENDRTLGWYRTSDWDL